MIEVTEEAQEKLLEHIKSQDDAMAVRVMVTAG
jgi:Fe-S cluster assembly iron-binding protein IscA